MKRFTLFLAFLAVCVFAVGFSRLTANSNAQPFDAKQVVKSDRDIAFENLLLKTNTEGNIHVIVGLNAGFQPEGLLAKTDVSMQRSEIKNAQENFLNRYQSLRFGDVKKFEYIPYLAFEADPQMLEQMRNDESVLHIEEDIIGDAALAQSTQIVGAPAAWTSGYTGSGQTVAILDSGVDKNHEFLSGRVVSEGCYSSNNASSTSFCPGGATTSTAPDSGLHCPVTVDGCAHGTNVAGIAAGRGTSFSGVARDANIIAIQMFSQFTCNGSPCARYWTSDLIRALERVKTLSDTMPNIAAVNLSLQTGQQFISNCDSAHSATKAAVDNLRSVNIPTVICSGNYAFTNALTAPACISSSISVGSTDDGSSGTSIDTVSNFSDSSPLLHLLAPGRWINSSIPNNQYQNYSGTSMAAPHVVGAFAIMRQKRPNAGINQILNALISTGQPILDTRNNITKPRIKIAQALNALSTANYDFDGDFKTDIGIFRPAVGEWWYLRSGDNQNFAVQFGSITDRIVPADFTGDGKTDIAFWRPASGEWFVIRSEDNSFYAFPFGSSGDIPAPGDFDGDGKADTAVFRPSNATWYILRSSDNQVSIIQFGVAEDLPVVADYDGDGKSDIAIFRPSVSEWWLLRSTAGLQAVQFGQTGDKTVQGDYTGDGKDDIAFWRPSSGEWFILRSEDNSFYAFPFGLTDDIPTPGDYDGDGKADAAVFRPSNSTWYLQRSTSGFTAIGFGINGDQPIPNAFVR